jgi:RNA polymerase sigma-70 factor (ECF subfamily)
MVLEEVRLKIDQGIRQLSAPVQRVFLLSRFEGKANAAIAQELGLSVKTVEAHITRALATIRAALADAGLLSLVAFMLLAIRFLNR